MLNIMNCDKKTALHMQGGFCFKIIFLKMICFKNQSLPNKSRV